MNKKILIPSLLLIAGATIYLSGINLSFFGLRSAILTAECTSSQLQSNKAEYDRSITELSVINNYITLNTCELNGVINNLKSDFEIAACQRKINLRNNKQTFIDGYLACQNSINAGPRVMSGAIVNDGGLNYRTLIEQEEGEDMHINESVYTLYLRAQGESYVRELVYELNLPLINNDVGVRITKAGLSSSKNGLYSCAQSLSPTQTDTTKKTYLITCRATNGGYEMGVDDDNAPFAVNLDLSVSTILATGEGTLKFISGKYSTSRTSTDEKPLTRITNVGEGTLKYTMAFVDPRDLTVNIAVQSNTSSTVIPVRAEFNKLVDIASVGNEDFTISENATSGNLICENVADATNGLRTVCTLDVEPANTAVAADITIDMASGVVRDKTRNNPKTNAAATQRIVHYVYGAPKIFVGAPCGADGGTFCSGLDSTPQLIARAAVGDVPAGSVVRLYGNTNCTGTPLQEVSTTRDMPLVDLYEPNSLTKNETKSYTVKIGNSCSALGTIASGKQAGYQYTGETIAQVNRLASCMSNTTFPNTKFSVGPYVANTAEICDTGDMVSSAKCNAWQGNATFNNECFTTGKGTVQNPYRVCTPEQLQEMDNLPGKHFRLGKNIDLTLAGSWFGGKGFQPIGRTIHGGFYGSLDGNGFAINNLKIVNPDNYVGLFGMAQGASLPGVFVSNLKLNNARIQSPGTHSGTLMGVAGCAIISGVESTGINISGAQSSSGGLVGETWYETRILYSKTQGVLATADTNMIAAVGGVVGRSPGSIFEMGNSESSVNIYAKAHKIGGLVGHIYGAPANLGSIHDSVSKGFIRARNGSSTIGGIIGDGSYINARGNDAAPSGNKIIAEGSGTVGYIGGFIGMAQYSELSLNNSRYNIEGDTAGSVGGFGGSIGASKVLMNSSEGAVGGENSKGPRGYYIGGFAGVTNGGEFYDNYATGDVYLGDDAPAAYIGGFSGMVGAGKYSRNYSSGTLTANHAGSYDFGGFAGYLEASNGVPFDVSDNYTTSNYVDAVGLYGTWPDYSGGFVGVLKKAATDTFANNYYSNENLSTCTGKEFINVASCTKVATIPELYSTAHPVYTRSGGAWDFTGTWTSRTDGLPLLKDGATVGI